MSQIEVERIASLTGHKDCVYTLAGSGKDHIFYSAAADGMVVEWDLTSPDTGQLIAKLPNSIYCLEYLPGKNQLLIGQNFEGVHLIDLSSKKEIASAKITDAAIFDIKLGAKHIYVGTGDGTLIVLDKKDLSIIARLKYSDKSLRCISLAGSRNVLAAGFSDHTIKLVELDNFTVLHSLSAHQNSIFTLTYSPDGRYLLSGGRDAHLKIWDVQDGYSLEKSIVAHLYAVNNICYHPSGKYFATCSMDKSIKIWNAEDFSLLKVIDKARHAGHGTSVNKLFWSSYQEQLVSCSDDRSISVWNIKFNDQNK
ncbi:MAG TPA: WD40 repeat domain-containing protein [Cytophagaceae bacterium]|nr:WD40 repeat domain-containing protein [Cytophagaceae bacterium]